MKTIQLASALLTSATLAFSILPAFGQTQPKTGLPDLSNPNNPLAACKTINVGTIDRSQTQSAIIGTLDISPIKNTNGNLVDVKTTQKDIQPVIGHDCDGIANAISKVETNREDNETYRHVADRKAEVELIKNLMSW
jgi:hypothetical protein